MMYIESAPSTASPPTGSKPMTLFRPKRKRVPGSRNTASIIHARRRSRARRVAASDAAKNGSVAAQAMAGSPFNAADVRGVRQEINPGSVYGLVTVVPLNQAIVRAAVVAPREKMPDQAKVFTDPEQDGRLADCPAPLPDTVRHAVRGIRRGLAVSRRFSCRTQLAARGHRPGPCRRHCHPPGCRP